MTTSAQTIIIGGGAVGASALYHLALRGHTDVLLLEMDELTSGSTWHAAGNVPTYSGSRNIIRLQHYSTELYARLAVDPDYPINYHQTGSIRLAQTDTRMQEFEHVTAMARSMGIEYEMLDTAEMQARNPFLEVHGLKGGLWDAHDGDIDPSQLTQALATAARKLGATIQRFTRVTGIERVGSEWKLTTTKGDFVAETVINAGGYRGQEVGHLAGLFLPLVSMEHQYLVTESVPELEGREALLPLVRDPDDSYYLRQEKSGLILGPYEWQATPHWADGQLPEAFAYELYADDLERLEWYIEQACARMPVLGSVGVQRVINGPIPYSPDGLPYVGPAYGLPNFYHACGFSFGICQAGGAGKSIAEWVLDGKPEWDLWSLDPRRYTDYATQDYVTARAIEVYQNEYVTHFPHKEWPAGRPGYATPLYDSLAAKGAQFGARGGWERATWFARSTDKTDVDESYHRGPWFDAVAEECRHVSQHAGLLDLGGFTRLEVSGEDAAVWLDGLIAGRLPGVGRVGLAYFCAEDGGVWSEMTISRLDQQRFVLISAAAALWHDQQWLQQHLPDNTHCTVKDITRDAGTLVLAGPRSRDILQKLTNSDLSNEAFPWLSCREMSVAGIDLLALRVNYVGELGWELHVPVAQQKSLYDALMEAGEDVPLRDFGLYAMDSMRLEKSYRAWKAELDHAYSPLRSGLQRFVALDKPAPFVGQQALRKEVETGADDCFCTLLLDDSDMDAIYGATIEHDNAIVGFATSGGFGHRIGKSIVLGYIKQELAVAGTAVQVRLFGDLKNATVVAESPYDANNERLRS